MTRDDIGATAQADGQGTSSPTAEPSPRRLATSSSLWLFLALGVVFLPYPDSRLLPLPVAVALGAVVMCLVAATRLDGRRLRAALVWLFVLALTSSAMYLATFATGGSLAPGVSTYAVTLPLGLLAGWSLTAAALESDFARCYRAWCYGVAGLAVAEHISRSSFFGYRDFVQAGVYRPTAGQFHPIILGAVLCVGIAFAGGISKRSSRFTAVAVCLLGIWTTDSLGPLTVGVVVGVLVFASELRRVLSRPVLAVAGTCVAGWAFIAWFNAPIILGATASAYSANYRGALYSLVPRVIALDPFGYGPGGLPVGTWLVESQYLGVRDISQTVDAEPVLLVAEWGVVGVAAILAVLWVAVAATRDRSSMMGLALLALTVNGFTVALHAWESLALLWFLLLGASLPIAMRTRRVAAGAPRARRDRRR